MKIKQKEKDKDRTENEMKRTFRGGFKFAARDRENAAEERGAMGIIGAAASFSAD